MSVQVKIHWYRHAESEANAVIDTSTIASLARTWVKEMGMMDPTLSQNGHRQIDDVQPPIAQLVIASHLRRSIETALKLYPTQKIHIMCGLNEIPPGLPNISDPTSISHLAKCDIHRLVPAFDQSKCGLLKCKQSRRFWPEFDKLVLAHCEKTGTSEVEVAIVGHALWLMVNLWQSKFKNLERRTTTRTVPTK